MQDPTLVCPHGAKKKKGFSPCQTVMQKRKDFLRYRLNIGAGMKNRTQECLTVMAFSSVEDIK